jgi:hypothetical protein
MDHSIGYVGRVGHGKSTNANLTRGGLYVVGYLDDFCEASGQRNTRTAIF